MDELSCAGEGGDTSISPLVASVARRLMSMIESRTILAGNGLPSERRLSQEFEVSRGVVRAAIKKLAEEGLIDAKVNCRPIVRTVQPSKQTGRRHLNIWLWPNTSDFAAASILKGIQSSNLDSDIRLMIGNVPSGDWDSIYEAERLFLESLAEDPSNSCAILWYLGGEKSLPELQKLRKLAVPLVFVDRMPPQGFVGDFVGTNNETSVEFAMNHLIQMGHRKIAMITNMDGASTVAERERGYYKALQTAGIKPRPEWVQRDKVDEPVGIRLALDNILGSESAPTAIFCINDHLALQMYEELQARGIKVPDELSLIGFDGLLRWLPGGGYLTTMCQDFERIGQTAAQIAMERISGGESLPYRHFYFDARFMDRGSTCPCQIPYRENNDVKSTIS